MIDIENQLDDPSIATEINKDDGFYYPASLNEAIRNAVVNTLKLDKKELIYLSGYYHKDLNCNKKDVATKDYFYDSIECNGEIFSVKIHKDLRCALIDNTYYSLHGYIKQNYPHNGFHFMAEKAVAKREENCHASPEEIVCLNKKINGNYVELNRIHWDKRKEGYNLKNLINSIIRSKRPYKIALLCPEENAVASDIKNHLTDEVKEVVDFEIFTCKFNKKQIIDKVSYILSHGHKSICLARGGGEYHHDFSMFNDALFIKMLLSMKCLFMTALGHDENIHFLDTFADESFSTPSFLASTVTDYVREARAVDKNSKLLEEKIKLLAVYEERIKILENKHCEYNDQAEENHRNEISNERGKSDKINNNDYNLAAKAQDSSDDDPNPSVISFE